RDTTWKWQPTGATARSTAVLFPAEGTPVPSVGSTPDPAPMGLFLPPGETRVLGWGTDAEVLAVWVPELLLQEFTEGATPSASPLYASPLTNGFRTFAQAIVRYPDEGSSMSQYAIERLLAEMTFGALVEQQSVETGH